MRPERPWRARNKQKSSTDATKKSDQPIPPQNKEVRAVLEDAFAHSSSLVMRDIRSGKDQGMAFLVVYFLGLADANRVSETVLEPLLADHRLPLTRTNAIDVLQERLVTNASVERVETVDHLIERILSGRVIILPEGSRVALACDVSGTPHRGISEPETEGVARGPHEGFIEQVEVNVSLIRRRLRTTNLQTEQFIMGRHTKTRVILVYIQGIAADSIIEEARSRLSRIGENIDGILLSQTVAELIEDHPFSLFPTINATERPERVAAGLLEGRFAVFTEGTPFTLMAPTHFAEFLTSSADYAERAFTVAVLRAVRLVALFTMLFLPSIYVALVSFHQETIPTLLLLSIAQGREGVPFPPIGEALLMETAFEVIREAGIRLPRLGNAVSIVGVLVVGQAAVAAGVVSPILIIVVGATAISSFTLPNFPAANVLRFLRFPILLFTGAFGAVGIAISFIFLTLHLVSLRSFGAPFMAPLAPFKWEVLRKAFLRQPIWTRSSRPSSMWPEDTLRATPNLMPRPPRRGQDDGRR